MGLRRYVARRIVYVAVLVLFIIAFNFFLFQILPFITSCPSGNTYNQCFENFYLPEVGASHNLNATLFLQNIRNHIAKDYGLNETMGVRFVLYFRNMLTFNFGYHINGGDGPVLATIQRAAPWTILLLGSSTIASFVVGIGLGVIAAAKRGKILDVSLLAVLLFVNSLPVFFLAALLQVGQFSISGVFYQPLGASIFLTTGLDYYSGIMQSLFLPFLALTLINVGSVFLTQRAVMLDVVAEDYILMARAKGLPERTVLFKHAFRNAVLPIFTAFALAIGFILSGAVITETVFGWPGLGRAIYLAVIDFDFPMEQAMFLVISLMVLLVVFIADITYGFLDPRVSTS